MPTERAALPFDTVELVLKGTTPEGKQLMLAIGELVVKPGDPLGDDAELYAHMTETTPKPHDLSTRRLTSASTFHIEIHGRIVPDEQGTAYTVSELGVTESWADVIRRLVGA